jgi:hypothetical protein
MSDKYNGPIKINFVIIFNYINKNISLTKKIVCHANEQIKNWENK